MQTPSITIAIDGEPVVLDVRTITVRDLLVRAGLDPGCFYLIEVKGRNQDSYLGRLDHEIHLHPHQTFVTARIEAVCPVS